MKYIKSKAIVTDLTTMRLHRLADETIINYLSTDIEINGVVLDDVVLFLASQPSEIEAVEVSYESIKDILNDCQLMESMNQIIENRIAEKYSIGKELKMRDLPLDDSSRIEYEMYKTSIKVQVNEQKKALGLIQ